MIILYMYILYIILTTMNALLLEHFIENFGSTDDDDDLIIIKTI